MKLRLRRTFHGYDIIFFVAPLCAAFFVFVTRRDDTSKIGLGSVPREKAAFFPANSHDQTWVESGANANIKS